MDMVLSAPHVLKRGLALLSLLHRNKPHKFSLGSPPAAIYLFYYSSLSPLIVYAVIISIIDVRN
jgi:hypothetical protein